MNTSDRLALVAIGISIFAMIFSWYTFSKTDEMAKVGYNKNYRPYVAAVNFSFANKDGVLEPVMNTVMIKIFNAPALITSQKTVFYTREDNVDTLLFRQPEQENYIIYPFDNNQVTSTVSVEIVSHSLAEKILPKVLVRKIRVDYQWISGNNEKYFFESESVYDVRNHAWTDINQSAN